MMTEVIMIEKYVSEFIRLCGEPMSLDDCGDKRKVRKHNAKMRKLHKLYLEITKDPIIADAVVLKLLTHESEDVRTAAAGRCLTSGYHLDKAVQIMEYAAREDNPNGMQSVEASISLEAWRKKHS